MPATPGDFDVDGTDLLLWQRGASPHNGGVADLAPWRVNFGPGGTAVASGAVPEPSTLALLLVGLLTMSSRRRVVAS